MPEQTFKQYLLSLKPTARGASAVALCLIIIPVFCDLFLVVLQANTKLPVTIGFTLVNGYIRYLPFYIIYIPAYFIILNGWNSIIKNLNIEKFHFGS
jgi:hypothetical protein